MDKAATTSPAQKEKEMRTTTLTAPDISCDHCKTTIEREVGALDGVNTVIVDIPSRHVTITYDPAQVAETDVVSKLDDEGYPIRTTR